MISTLFIVAVLLADAFVLGAIGSVTLFYAGGVFFEQARPIPVAEGQPPAPKRDPRRIIAIAVAAVGLLGLSILSVGAAVAVLIRGL